MVSFNIIIPCFNSAKTLSRTLDSVIAQKDFLHAIILIDDGSTDETAHIAKKYIAQFPALIEYHYQENQGPAAARNHGARLAKGDYVLFLDADDTLTPQALEQFTQAFSKTPNTDIILAGYCSVHEKSQKPRLPKVHQKQISLVRDLWFGNFSLCGGATAIRASLLKSYSYPEKIKHGEDIVFFSHILANHHALILPFVALNVYHRTDSLRHHTKSILDESDEIVELLFDPKRLNDDLMSLKNEYHAKRLIGLARTAIKAGDKKLARRSIHQAMRLHPRSFFKIKNVKALLGSYF